MPANCFVFQINGNRTAITSNDLIEGTLGRFGIICVEDLIHEVRTWINRISGAISSDDQI